MEAGACLPRRPRRRQVLTRVAKGVGARKPTTIGRRPPPPRAWRANCTGRYFSRHGGQVHPPCFPACEAGHARRRFTGIRWQRMVAKRATECAR